MMEPINPAVIQILGFGTVLWGLWVASPYWTVFTQAPLYEYMAGIAPEWFWGLTAVVAGVGIVIGVSKNSYRSLRTGALIGFLFWIMLTVMYVLGDWTSTGPVTSLMFAAYSGFVAINIRVNRYRFGYSGQPRMFAFRKK